MKRTLFCLVLAFVTFACGNNPQNHGEKINLSLNNGQKWEVNDEMKPHIDQGENVLKDYISKGNSDYKKLARDLKSQNTLLIKSCTMKGESHDELHKWLHPHMNLIKDLEKAKTPEEADKAINDIGNSFNTYNSYFN